MILVKSFLVTLSILEVLPIPDYYWRNYYGEIPRDAVVAGKTSHSTVYIGRAPFEKRGLVVGTIIEGFRNVIIASGSKRFRLNSSFSIDKHVEILCSPRPFKWVPTNITQFSNVAGKVVGGYEPDNKSPQIDNLLYIGRVKYDNKFKIGKIVDYFIGHYIVYPREPQETWAQNYEVLVVYDDRNYVSYPTCSSSSQNSWYPDYYWRNYTGNLPHDAFRAGYAGGISTYIGRAAHENVGTLLVPIVPGNKADSEYRFIEIMCTSFPKRFSWVKTPVETIFNRNDLVEIGTKYVDSAEETIGFYVGRILMDDRFIFEEIKGYGGKSMYYNAKGEDVGTVEYEVLTYSDDMEP